MSSPEETTTAPETSGEAEAPEEAAPRDEVREQALADLRDELGDAVIDTYVRPGQASWARVSRDAWHEVAVVAKEKLGYDFFDFLSAIDWLPSPFGRDMNAQEDLQDEAESEAPTTSAEPGAIERGYTGGETRFQLLASLYDTRRHLGILLKTDLPDDDLTAQSWSDVFWGADWHERETAEMFGIEFVGHPNLINIYLPTDFEGHPLRKDYPLLARRVKPWPGIVDVEPMPPSDEPAADDVPAGDGTDGGEDGGEASGGDES